VALTVSDTSPINYLILIQQIQILPLLFGRIAIPRAVYNELLDVDAPGHVRSWITDPPAWLEIHDSQKLQNECDLDEGESAAIALAKALRAQQFLIDERLGFHVAQREGLNATGTLGVLDLAASRQLLNFEEAIGTLKQTNFRLPRAVADGLLAKHRAKY
jgi:predicted nucleic acid-binding protein